MVDVVAMGVVVVVVEVGGDDVVIAGECTCEGGGQGPPLPVQKRRFRRIP